MQEGGEWDANVYRHEDGPENPYALPGSLLQKCPPKERGTLQRSFTVLIFQNRSAA